MLIIVVLSSEAGDILIVVGGMCIWMLKGGRLRKWTDMVSFSSLSKLPVSRSPSELTRDVTLPQFIRVFGPEEPSTGVTWQLSISLGASLKLPKLPKLWTETISATFRAERGRAGLLLWKSKCAELRKAASLWYARHKVYRPTKYTWLIHFELLPMGKKHTLLRKFLCGGIIIFR